MFFFLFFSEKVLTHACWCTSNFKLYRARSGYIRAITITFTLIVILYPLRCGSIQSQCLAPFAPRALTPAPALHHTQYGLSPFLTPPARRNAVLTIRATYCLWLFWTYFFGFYTYTASCANPYRLHRVCTITAQNTFHRSCGQASSIYPYSIRTDLFHTTFQIFTNSSQTRHKLVTSDLQSHVQKRIQPAICTNVVLFILYERMHNPPAYIDWGRNSIQYTAKQLYHCKWQGTLTP